MKRLSFFCSTMYFAIILFFAASCTKESTPAFHTNYTIKQPVTSTLDILLNEWTFVNGVYISTLSMPRDALAVYVVNENQVQELTPNPIDYLGGKLWLNIYGKEAVFSYRNEFNEKPFKLNSTIIEMKLSE